MADGFALRMDNLAYASAAERTMNAVSWMPGSSAVLPRAGVKPGATFSIAVLTGPDRVTVPAHGGMLLSTPASGATCYQYVLPTAVTKSFAARPGAGTSRIDLIVVRVYDATADVSTALKELDVEIIAGTAAASPVAPTQPNGTLLLGMATVPNSASIVITTPPPRTVATGGIVPVANAADLATLVPYDGLMAYQEDTDVFYGRANGAWVALSTSASTTPWVAWTPALVMSGYSLGNGTAVGRYQQIGKTVHCRARITAGTTSNFGSAAAISVSLPLPLLDPNGVRWPVGLNISGNNYVVFTYGATAGGTSIPIATLGTSGILPGGVTNTSPAAMGTGTIVEWAFTYETS